MLEVTGLNSFYGEFQILHDISITVGDGEFVAILGPNGHGKSTLLKTICGLHKQASGSIKFNGIELMPLPAEKLVEMGIVYVPEDRHLFPYLSVLNNLKLGAYTSEAHSKEADNLDYVLNLFPMLRERIKSHAETLSGGEGRMLAIARGLMSAPQFLALDEPSFGLAPKLKDEVFQTIGEINKAGKSILLVEQDATKAADADRIYVIEDGRVVLEGTSKEVISNRRVREVFLGV